MSSISEKRKIQETMDVEVEDRYDVIVAGAGPAGIGAAIAASRNGMKTLLVERYGFAGGMWTAGMINPIFDHENKGGILAELIEQLRFRNAWGGFIKSCHQYEVLKYVLDHMLIDAGVFLRYHTWIARPIVNGSKVEGIITESKSGRKAFSAQVVIDSTGDGDVAAGAGAEFDIGRPNDGKTQPMTLMFVLGNINYEQTDPQQLYHLMKEAIEREETNFRINYQYPFIIQLPHQNSATVMLTHIRGVSGLDAGDLTRAEIEGRKEVMETVQFFKKYIPAFKNVELVSTAPQVGVRETRRIRGEYVLTIDDLIEGRQFDDGITTATFNVDIHDPVSTDQKCFHVKPYQIPYRCLVPRKIENVLVAGRCISGTYEAHASYRVTGNCIAMGQAAGTASALAITQNTTVKSLDTSTLIQTLREQGTRACGS